MHTKNILLGFTLCASVLTAPLSGLQSEGTVSRSVSASNNNSTEVVEQREEAAKKAEMHTSGLGIWKRTSTDEASSRSEMPAVNKRTGFGIISGGSNEEA